MVIQSTVGINPSKLTSTELGAACRGCEQAYVAQQQIVFLTYRRIIKVKPISDGVVRITVNHRPRRYSLTPGKTAYCNLLQTVVREVGVCDAHQPILR